MLLQVKSRSVLGFSLFSALTVLVWLHPLDSQAKENTPHKKDSAIKDAPTTPFESPLREEEDDAFGFKFGFYYQNDGPLSQGGNLVLDEDETVYEAIIFLDKAITEKDKLHVQFLGDIVSSASIARYHDPLYRFLQSNPSGNKHGEISASWTHQFEGFYLGGSGLFSAEFSRYYSFGGGFHVGTALFDDNTFLEFRFEAIKDYFQIKLFNGFEPGYDKRDSFSESLSITQVLTPQTLVNLTWDHTNQNGYLATTYNAVFFGGLEHMEIAPAKRRRDALTLRAKQSLSQSNAIEVGYRYYNDSWAIDSHTMDSRFFQYVWNRRILLEPNYQFYEQDPAYFYQPVFFFLTPLRTADPDLGDFDSHIFGIKVTLLDPKFFPSWKGDIDIGFNYNLRSDDLEIFWITAGYILRF
jgi:hypothetical protein